ncbi:MAG: substrate-binding domain-containing protein [Phycisphaeraceae bacterium JB051]
MSEQEVKTSPVSLANRRHTPRTQVAYEQIKSDIQRARYGLKDFLPPMRQIAGELGVATNTVWRVMKQLEKEQWVKLSENGRYRVDQQLEKTVLKRHNILMVVEGMDHITRSIFQQVYDTLRDDGLKKQLAVSLQMVNVEKAFDSDALRGTDAVLLCGPFHGSPLPASLMSGDLDIPVLGVNTPVSFGLSHTIQTDHFAGGEMAAQHLFEHGYREVALLCGNEDNPAMEAFELRVMGFRTRWMQLGMGANTIHELKCPLQWISRSVQLLTAFFEQRPALQACFCLTDAISIFAYQVLTEMGRNVPKDIGLMGFDGSQRAYWHQPRLASLKQEMQAIAYLAMQRLREMIEKRPIDQPRMLVAPCLVPGDSLQDQNR